MQTITPKHNKLFTLLRRQMVSKNNYYTPWPFDEGILNKEYTTSVEASILAALELLNTSPASPYLLPNAWILRNITKIDLKKYISWVRAISCLRTTREIWNLCRSMVRNTRSIHPATKDFLLPSCCLNSKAEINPPCPHKGAYCGVQAWRYDIFDITFERSY